MIVALWAVLHAGLVKIGASPVLDGNLVDPDSFMRLVRVTQLHETGAWYDTSVPRINAPYGDVLHWTRPFDVLLLVGAWALTPFLGFKAGLFWFGAIVSPLLSLLACVALFWAMAPLFDRPRRYLTVFAFLMQPAVLIYAMAGRADHHALQVVVLVVSAGLMLRLLTRPADSRLALAAGAATGLGIWVSVEFLLALACGLSALGLVWLRFGGGWARVNLVFAGGLAGMVALALAIERPAGALLAVEYDRISVVHLVVALILLGFWSAVLGWRRAAALVDPRHRLALAAAGAVAGGVILLVLFPKFFAGPMADVDPMVVTVWMDHVGEMKSLMPADMVGLGKLMFFIGPAILCLPFVAVLLWVERDRENWPAWLYLGLAMALFVTVALQHVRFAPYAEITLAPVIAELLARMRHWTQWIGREPLRLAVRVVASAGLLAGFVGAGSVVTAANRPADAVADQAKCPISSLAAYLDRRDGFGDHPRLIAALIDHGPELVYRTKHSVLAGPYHRNSRGILDNHRIITADDESESRRLIARRGVGLVLLCPSRGERRVFDAGAEGETLYRRLLRGDEPAWLLKVDLPAALAEYFRLYEVRG